MALSLQKNGKTTLEKVGKEARNAHLSRNEWVKGYFEYTKSLVSSEYKIQQEFKID